jgi:hypothetical protein
VNNCVQANDPINLFMDKALLALSGQQLPKTWVAWLADALGDSQLASAIRLSAAIVGDYTTLPSSLSAALRLGGRSSLRLLGRLAAPVQLAYGVALAAVEAGCALGSCGK